MTRHVAAKVTNHAAYSTASALFADRRLYEYRGYLVAKGDITCPIYSPEGYMNNNADSLQGARAVIDRLVNAGG